MIRYLCDVENCGKEAPYPNGTDWADQEMFEARLEGFKYFWFRVGIANITLCPEHRKVAMVALINAITKKYTSEPRTDNISTGN